LNVNVPLSSGEGLGVRLSDVLVSAHGWISYVGLRMTIQFQNVKLLPTANCKLPTYSPTISNIDIGLSSPRHEISDFVDVSIFPLGVKIVEGEVCSLMRVTLLSFRNNSILLHSPVF
jgi:hypothetical protein